MTFYSLIMKRINPVYPKTITIENNKLKSLLLKKAELVNAGRAKSEELEVVEKQMEEADKAVQVEEAKVDITDLNDKQKAIGAKVDEAIVEMNAVKQEIFDRMIKQVPAELHTKYDELKKKKEDLETERNKIALKAQKYNDKIIPLAKNMMKPFLVDQFDDYDTLNLQGDEIVATIFNHLVDFRNNFKKK